LRPPSPGAKFDHSRGIHPPLDVEDEDRKQAPIDLSKAEENKPKPTEDNFDKILTNALSLIAQTKGLISNYIVCQGMPGEQNKLFQLKIEEVPNLEKILEEVEGAFLQGRMKMEFATLLQVCNIGLHSFINKAFLNKLDISNRKYFIAQQGYGDKKPATLQTFIE
jgi:hypothetical protein